MKTGQEDHRAGGNIVLSGFMGSGKTTIGRRLASALQMRFVDMDRYIEQKAGMTVSEIFAQHGETHFRKLEAEAVRDLAQEKHLVIAAGGGTLMQPANVEAFHAGGGDIYYLDVPLRALQERLKRDTRRPLLQTEDRNAVIERLLSGRRPQYMAAADVVVDAGAPTVVVVKRICALCGIEPEAASLQPPRKKRKRGRRGGKTPQNGLQ